MLPLLLSFLQLSSSFYVYNISRNLHEAEQVFIAMGYKVVERQGRGGQDLVYEGEVNTQKVLDTATDLLVMHEEIGLIGELVAGGGGHVTLEQAIMQQFQTNTVQNTRSAGAHPQPQPPPQPQPQPQPGYSGYPPEGGEGSRYLGNDRGTSGGVLPQPPHQMMYGQPPQPVGQSPTAQGSHGVGGYERGVFAPLPLEAGVVAANQQQRKQYHDDPFTSEHEKLHQAFGRQGGILYENAEPPPDATLYENVQYQSAGSESALYHASDLLQLEANSKGNLENIAVTQEARKLFQQYPELARLPPQPGPPAEEPYSIDLKDLPPPVVRFTSTPASTPASLLVHSRSAITSSLVHSRSGGEYGRLSPLEEQPQALGNEVNEPEYQQQLQQQLNNPEYQQQQQQDCRPGRSPSTDSNMSSIDLYGSPQSQHLQHVYSRGRSTSTDSKESSIDIYTSGSGHKLAKYTLHPVHEEPTNPPSDPAPLPPSPLPRGTTHPLETNTQHPGGRPEQPTQPHGATTAADQT